LDSRFHPLLHNHPWAGSAEKILLIEKRKELFSARKELSGKRKEPFSARKEGKNGSKRLEKTLKN
jgi:hypothetical protein